MPDADPTTLGAPVGNSRAASGVLATEDYVRGLRAIEPKLSELQRRLLVAQYHAPDRTVYASQLAEALDVSGGHPAINSAYGKMGHRLCDALDHPPERRRDGSSRWWSVWSTGEKNRHGYRWTMRPQVAQALEQLGWVEAHQEPAERERRLTPRDAPPRRRAAAAGPLPESGYTRPAVAEGEASREHNRLQNELRSLLVQEYGEGAVVLEEDFVDIKVTRPDSSVELFEVKCERDARGAIRRALGQLVDYAVASEARGETVAALVVAAPAPLTQEAETYLGCVRELLRVPLRYREVGVPAAAAS